METEQHLNGNGKPRSKEAEDPSWQVAGQIVRLINRKARQVAKKKGGTPEAHAKKLTKKVKKALRADRTGDLLLVTKMALQDLLGSAKEPYRPSPTNEDVKGEDYDPFAGMSPDAIQLFLAVQDLGWRGVQKNVKPRPTPTDDHDE